MTFLELAERVLQEAQRPMTPEEIWNVAKQKGYDQQVGSKGKTPERSIGAQVYVDIRDNPDSLFYKAQTRPTRFFLKSLSGITQEPSIIEAVSTLPFAERDLHKVLAYYLYTFKTVYSKTIYHEESRKKQYAQWLHPDMVGVYFPFESWLPEVVNVASQLGSLNLKLFSYELKKELNYTNLRESFFQAVSNSSWAHEGYLVAADILKEDDFYQEIKRLSNAFGIGIIKLDIMNPNDSEIIIPAKEKEYVDIETINKLAEVSKNFKSFLQRIKNDFESREIRKEQYDHVLSEEELILFFNKKRAERSLTSSRPVPRSRRKSTPTRIPTRNTQVS